MTFNEPGPCTPHSWVASLSSCQAPRGGAGRGPQGLCRCLKAVALRVQEPLWAQEDSAAAAVAFHLGNLFIKSPCSLKRYINT